MRTVALGERSQGAVAPETAESAEPRAQSPEPNAQSPEPMFSDLSTLHVALAVGPFVGVAALREFWGWRRHEAEIRAREERAHAARREAMRAMQEALNEAEAAKKTRDEFLARMSHELRTPLNAVIGFSRVLENNKAGNQRPEDIRMLERVRAGGEQLLRLVEDVLDHSRIERGQLDLALDQTSVVEIVEKVVKDYRSSASLKGIKLQTELPAGVPMIQLDAGRFGQVLAHLVDNAIKFTGEGVVKITLVTDAATHLPTRLIVSDTGIGIPANQLDAIFEPFMQGESSARRTYGGAGLGLPLARQLCEAMRCQLSVESQVKVGSRFVIRFPPR
jgi:signal transduction histidine kinase